MNNYAISLRIITRLAPSVIAIINQLNINYPLGNAAGQLNAALLPVSKAVLQHKASAARRFFLVR